MHSITLSFATLAELGLAVTAVDRAMKGALGENYAERAGTPPAVAHHEAGKGKPKAEKPAPAPAPVAAPEAPAPAASAPAASAPKADAIDYPTLQKAVFKLAGMPGGRDAATALLEQFEVKTFKDVAAERWVEALAAVNAKIDELTVAA